MVKRLPKFIVTGKTRRGRIFTETLINEIQLNTFKKTHKAFGGSKLKVTRIRR